MNKGLGFLIVGVLAIVGGAVCAGLLIKKKMNKSKEDYDDFDDFDTAVDDEEFEHFFGDSDEDKAELEASDETDGKESSL